MNRYHANLLKQARQRLYATDAQKQYLKRLLIEAFSHHYKGHANCYDYHHLDNVTKQQASDAIQELLYAKKRNWDKI
jgi:hypothetical protein